MVAEGVEPALIENAARSSASRSGRCSSSTRPRSTSASRSPRRPRRRWATPTRRARPTTCSSPSPTRAGSGARPRPASTPTTRPASARASGRASPTSGRARAEQPPLTEVQHRLAMVQTLEAVRALEEGVLTDIREGDVGAILGWGFMPWSGGPFSWLDILGAARAVEICRIPRRRPRPALRAAPAPARPRRRGRDLLRPLQPGREGRLIPPATTHGSGGEPPLPQTG